MDMTPIAASAFATLLERATGQQLVAGRRWRIEAALGPVMRAAGIDSLDRLALEVGRNATSPLATTIVEALLNNETSFFRDAAAFRGIIGEALPAIAAGREHMRRLRIWSAGCSTGQEVWSLAMLIGRDDRWRDWEITIVGTDISHQALARARAGQYSQMEVQRGLPITDLIGSFDQDGEDWRVAAGLRGRVSFLQHNLHDAPPAGSFDLILCRNVLFYFAPPRRARVLDRLAGALAPDGLLMLGAGETVLGLSEAFVTDPGLRGFYRRAPG